VAVVATDGLGTAELEWTTHEFFTAEFRDGSAGFFHRAHGNEGKTFGTLSAIIDDDLRIAHATDAIEELKEITFRGIVGKIADVEAICVDRSWINRSVFTTWATGLTRWTRSGVAISAWWAWTATCG
jgi:hypothetical protein